VVVAGAVLESFFLVFSIRAAARLIASGERFVVDLRTNRNFVFPELISLGVTVWALVGQPTVYYSAGLVIVHLLVALEIHRRSLRTPYTGTKIKVILCLPILSHLLQSAMLFQLINQMESVKIAYSIAFTGAVCALGYYFLALEKGYGKASPKPANSTPANSTPAKYDPRDEIPSEQEATARSANALRENIQKKGENSYYFAHAKTPTKANVNKGEAPVLLESHRRESMPENDKKIYQVIRNFGFADGKTSVTIYIDLKKNNIEYEEVTHITEHTESGFKLTIQDLHVLQVTNLKHEIVKATSKLNSSKDQVKLILKKKDTTQAWASLT